MFIFRWIRTLLALIGLGTVIFWGYQYLQTDSPVKGKVEKFRKSPVFQEGVKDLKTWAGEVFKGVGERMQDDVTDDEKKQLDEILRKELAGEDLDPKEKVIKTKVIHVIKKEGSANKEEKR